MSKFYLGIDELPTAYANGYPNAIDDIGIKINGIPSIVHCENYEVLCKDQCVKTIRQELWDNLQEAICGMSAYDFVSKFGTHLNNTFFESITPEEFLDVCRQWQEEKDKRSYENELVEKVREDIRKTVKPLCDIGYEVEVNIHKGTEE